MTHIAKTNYKKLTAALITAVEVPSLDTELVSVAMHVLKKV